MPKARLAPGTGGCFAASCCRSAMACCGWPCCNFCCVSFTVAGSPGDGEGVALCPKHKKPENSSKVRQQRVRITHLKNTLRCRVLRRFRNYCGLIKIARSGFPSEKTTKSSFASLYTNCETAVAFAEWLFGTEGKPPDFLSRLLAVAKFIRLSLTKAAHAVVSGAACRK